LWGRLPSPLLEIILIVFSVLSGAMLGDERQRREKPAGLRTLVLVCLGAAIFTMTGFAFTSATGDSGRVAAQIVTGIGFLGAGVILHGKHFVTGVTTAAVNGFLKLAGLFETRWHPDLHDARFVIEYAPKNGLTRVRLERIFIDYEPVGVVAKWDDESRAVGRVTLTMRLARGHLYELLVEIADVPDVTAVTREQCEKLHTA
jgi:putative Mg2+ transporter-C (MgtC) family protein